MLSVVAVYPPPISALQVSAKSCAHISNLGSVENRIDLPHCVFGWNLLSILLDKVSKVQSILYPLLHALTCIVQASLLSLGPELSLSPCVLLGSIVSGPITIDSQNQSYYLRYVEG